jgi:hypothetical protein
MDRALLLAVTFVIAISTVKASLEASLGVAAVSSALKQSKPAVSSAPDPSVVRASDGPSATLLIQERAGQAVPMQDMAIAARDYLDTVFEGQPEALQRVQTAYEKETSQGFRGKHPHSFCHHHHCSTVLATVGSSIARHLSVQALTRLTCFCRWLELCRHGIYNAPGGQQHDAQQGHPTGQCCKL